LPDNIAINHLRLDGSIPGNLFEVVTIFSPFPRVATASQPWALLGNGFAVATFRNYTSHPPALPFPHSRGVDSV
jgi:hypothetical protein